MIRFNKIALVAALSMCIAGAAWAGGAACESKTDKAGAMKAEAKSGACTFKSGAPARAAGAGHACEGVVGKQAAADQCGVKANQVMYSFAVPGAECDHCVDAIQKAALATKGIDCAHVDLKTHTAYIIADKSMDKKAVAKVIQEAGFKNSFKGTGTKVQAEFAAAMKTSTEKGMSCCMKEKKDKV
jgi:copper chaperone CopZ